MLKKHKLFILGMIAILVIPCFVSCRPDPVPVTPVSETPTASDALVYKDSETQPSVVFTLTSANDGVWKVYTAQTGGSVHSTVTASFNADTRILTLTDSGGDIAAGFYYVSVTESGKTESARLALEVLPFLPSEPRFTVRFGGIPADPVTVTGYQESVAKGGSLIITVDEAAGYDAFAWWLNGSAVSAATASYTVPLNTLTAGLNRVTVFAYKGGVPFSYELAFTVTN